jgi:hypothetical protein
MQLPSLGTGIISKFGGSKDRAAASRMSCLGVFIDGGGRTVRLRKRPEILRSRIPWRDTLFSLVLGVGTASLLAMVPLCCMSGKLGAIGRGGGKNSGSTVALVPSVKGSRLVEASEVVRRASSALHSSLSFGSKL